MWTHIKQAAKAAHDWARPWCQQCGRHAFQHTHCSLCGKITTANLANELRANFATHGVTNTSVRDGTLVCEQCFQDRCYSRCSKTGHAFKSKDDRSSEYFGSKIRDNLTPYHPDSKLSGPLSPEGFLLIEVEHEAVQERIANWAGGTKQEVIQGYHITRQLGTVRCDEHCSDPAEVEHLLMWHAAQIGGNGYIKFFWDKHIDHHEEEYVAGYGRRGNPYYRTRHYTTQYFTGHAVSVFAEPLEPRRKNKKTHRKK